jgi:hypothetical protein
MTGQQLTLAVHTPRRVSHLPCRSVSGIVKGPLPFFWGVSKTA